MNPLRAKFAKAVAQQLIDEHGVERAIELMEQAASDLLDAERALHKEVSSVLRTMAGMAKRLLH